MASKVRELNPTPTAEAEDEPSVVEPEIIAQVKAGEDTEELSDISEGYEGSTASTKGSSSFSSWYRRIAPLVRNKQVRVLSIINCILTIMNLIIFLSIVAFILWFIGLKIKRSQLLQQDMPCLYRFKRWSKCSQECWPENQKDPPYMWRKIDNRRLVMARGEGYAKCPSNIRKNLIQYAPCNVRKCPKALSLFTEWTHCIHKDPLVGNASGCYRMRKLPLEDVLINVDVANLIEDCPDNECLDFNA